MKHRTRVSALVVQDNRLLLVKHVHPGTGFTWWVPPGGGIEPQDRSIFDCAVRETFEESGLTVTCSRIAYIGEFEDNDLQEQNLELFCPADTVSGKVGLENVAGSGPDELYIKDAQWFSREALKQITVFPDLIRDRFWEDLAAGFPHPWYFGRH